MEALDAFFEVVIGFSDGELPCRYTPGRARVIGPSTTSIAEHKNFMFFVLYIIRTGATSFAFAGMLFGLDHASATFGQCQSLLTFMYDTVLLYLLI